MKPLRFYIIGHSVRDIFAVRFETLREAKRGAQVRADALGHAVSISKVEAHDYSEVYWTAWTAKPSTKERTP